MGHSGSKNVPQQQANRRLKSRYSLHRPSTLESNPVELPPTPLSPLQTAVLYKKHSKAEQLLNQSEDINGVGEIGLSLLHLAVLPNPPIPFHSVKYYEYLWKSSIDKEHKYNSVNRMVSLLCERGAKLTQDSFKINPLESLYYCATESNQCLHLATSLSKSVDITVDNIIRYSVWTLMHHRFLWSKLIPGALEYSKWGLKREQCRAIALFVKHGLRPDEYFSGITPECSSIFECCHELKEVRFMNRQYFCNQTIIYHHCSFDHWEFKVNIWLRFWDFNDPLSFAFNQHFVKILENSSKTFDIRNKLLIERAISSWLKAHPYRYSDLAEEVDFILILILEIAKQASRFPNKKRIMERMIDMTLLKLLLQMLTDIILTQKDMSKSVQLFISLSNEIYQLLIQVYGSHSQIPYVLIETFSISLARVIPLFLTTAISYSSPLSRFIALFDPNVNARNTNSGRTPIQDALLYGDIFMVQTLLEGGANPFTVDRDGNSFIDQLNSIIESFRIGPARQVYEETRDKYVILNKPYPLLTLAANAIVINNIPFAVLCRQPRLYNMLLNYLPPT